MQHTVSKYMGLKGRDYQNKFFFFFYRMNMLFVIFLLEEFIF